MFRFVLPAVRAVCFTLSALHRIFALLVIVCSFCDMRLSAILPRRVYELLQRVQFRRDFATCEIRQGVDSPCMRLVKFSGGVLLEIYRYEILKLSSKFRACRISTLKFHGQRCEQGKF